MRIVFVSLAACTPTGVLGGGERYALEVTRHVAGATKVALFTVDRGLRDPEIGSSRKWRFSGIQHGT